MRAHTSTTRGRRRRNGWGYTLSAIQARRDNYPNDLTLRSKADYIFQYIRLQFDDFINRRLQDRANNPYYLGDPTFYVSLKWNELYPKLNEQFGTTFGYESGELRADVKRHVFQKLRDYLESVYDSTKDLLLKNVFSYPTFEFKIGNRRNMIRLENLSNIDSVIEPQTISDANIMGNFNHNVASLGSDIDVVEYGQIYLDQINLADSFGIILPFKRDEHDNPSDDINRNRIRTLTFKSRKYGAFWPFVLIDEFRYFKEWLRIAQISTHPDEDYIKQHCAIYCIEQMPMEQSHKELFKQAIFEHTTEFIEGKKMKAKVELALFQDLFESLNLPYNLIININTKANVPVKYSRHVSRRSTARFRPNYPNIFVYVDECHYMYDFELPFGKEFVEHFKQIRTYLLTHHDENISEKDFYLIKNFGTNKETKDAKPIWLRDLIIILKNNNCFIPMSEVTHNNLMELPITGLEERTLSNKCNDENELYSYNDPGWNCKYNKVCYFDFEALPDTDKHIPFMCCLMKADYNPGEFPNICYNGLLNISADVTKPPDIMTDNYAYVFDGYNCVSDMLNFLLGLKPRTWDDLHAHLSDDNEDKYYTILCYAHNLMYDCRFLRGHWIQSYIEKQGRCLCQIHTNVQHHVKIIFKDFLSMTNCALKVLPSWFPRIFEGIRLKKEDYIYEMISLFVYKSVNNEYQFDKVMDFYRFEILLRTKGVSDERIQSFIEHYHKTCLREDWYDINLFNFYEYTKFYCIQDVKVLKVAHQMYRHDIHNSILDFDLDHFLTASSIAKKWVERDIYKVIKYVYKIRGSLQEFILNFCHGGRCMTARNRKWHIQEEILNIDAVSLYPSAMSKAYIPIGKPTVIPDSMLHKNNIFDRVKEHPLLENLFDEGQLNYKPFKSIAHFMVEIEIISINQMRDFPCIVRKTKNGKENSNTLGIVFVDNIGLQDLVNYHDITYRVIRGIWWQQYNCTTLKDGVKKYYCRRSYLIRDKIKELFELRKEMKRNKNPQEKIIKLLLNSGYGAMMQKPIKTDIRISNKTELQHMLYEEISSIKFYEQILDEHSQPTEYYISWHKADTSQHYNVAFLAALILSISKSIMNRLMYYLEDNHVPVYYTDTDSIHVNKQKWLEFTKEQWVGSNLGQFHNDYDGYEIGIYDEQHNSDNPYDLYAVEGYYLAKKIYCERVKSIKYPEREGIFFRMKGIPETTVKMFASQRNCSIMELYNLLYEDHGLTFNISQDKKIFRFGSHFIFNLEDFKRTIKCRYPKGNPEMLTIHLKPEPYEEEVCDVILRDVNDVVSNFLDINPTPTILAPHEEPVLDEYLIPNYTDQERASHRSRFYVDPIEEGFNLDDLSDEDLTSYF